MNKEEQAELESEARREKIFRLTEERMLNDDAVLKAIDNLIKFRQIRQRFVKLVIARHQCLKMETEKQLSALIFDVQDEIEREVESEIYT